MCSSRKVGHCQSPSHHALLLVGMHTTDLQQKRAFATDLRPQVYLDTHASHLHQKQTTHNCYESLPFHTIFTSALAHIGSGVATPQLVLHELPQMSRSAGD